MEDVVQIRKRILVKSPIHLPDGPKSWRFRVEVHQLVPLVEPGADENTRQTRGGEQGLRVGLQLHMDTKDQRVSVHQGEGLGRVDYPKLQLVLAELFVYLGESGLLNDAVDLLAGMGFCRVASVVTGSDCAKKSYTQSRNDSSEGSGLHVSRPSDAAASIGRVEGPGTQAYGRGDGKRLFGCGGGSPQSFKQGFPRL